MQRIQALLAGTASSTADTAQACSTSASPVQAHADENPDMVSGAFDEDAESGSKLATPAARECNPCATDSASSQAGGIVGSPQSNDSPTESADSDLEDCSASSVSVAGVAVSTEVMQYQHALIRIVECCSSLAQDSAAKCQDPGASLTHHLLFAAYWTLEMPTGMTLDIASDIHLHF